jgi:hypothetical protein
VIKAISVLLILIIICCSPPLKKDSWNRYEPVTFHELTNKFAGYIDMGNPNTMRIYTPQNAFRGKFKYIGITDTVSESEIMVIHGHFTNTEESRIKNIYIHKSLLEVDGIKGWFCFQESIYPDLKNLSQNKDIEVFYQFVGATNVNSDSHFIFIVTAWNE